MSAKMTENFTNVCRLCLSKEGLMLPIFHNRVVKNEISFRSKIMRCASIEIFADDDLPTKICFLCLHQVEKFFQFQKMCENSDAILRSQMKSPLQENTQRILDVKNLTEKQLSNLNDNATFSSDYYLCNDKLLGKKTNNAVPKCFVCSFVFLNNDLLIEHLKKTHPDIESFACLTCKISFSNIYLYQNHLNVEHSLTCDHCDCVFKHHKKFQEHLKTHSKENLSCKYCKKSFKSVTDMRKHEYDHSGRTCSYCLIEFNNKEAYYNHAQKCVQLYSCKFCKQKIPLKKDLIEHVNSCHDNSFPYICSNCNKTFMKPNELQEHKCESLNDIGLQHKNCQTNFDETSLLTHMSEEHDNDVLTCKFCNKKFTLKSSLKRHEKSHSGAKPYQCKFCPRKFKDSSACVVHTRTHTGEHPFQCQECHKDFKQLANLKMHTYRHHKKIQKSIEEKTEILKQSNNTYEQLYGGELVETYSNDIRGYQNLNDNISTTFNQTMNLLMSEQQ